MSKRQFTDAQRRALHWLEPSDECRDAPRSVSAALGSLVLYHSELVATEWKKTPRGRRYLAYTLTPLGDRERAASLEASEAHRK